MDICQSSEPTNSEEGRMPRGTGTSNHDIPINDDDVSSKPSGSLVTKGSHNITLHVGNHSSVLIDSGASTASASGQFNNQDPSAGALRNLRKRVHLSNPVEESSGPSTKCSKLDIDGSGEPMMVDTQHKCHNCLLERIKGPRVPSKKKKGKHNKRRLKLADIPNMSYNAMKLKVEKMSDDDLRDCIKLLKQDSRGSGLSKNALDKVESAEDLIKLMEDKNLLSPDNLCLLQMVLHRIGNEGLLGEIKEYVSNHEDDPISLFISKKKQSDGTHLVEFRIKGKAKHTRNRNVRAFKIKLSKNLGVKMHQIHLTGAGGEGSVILVFQIPEEAVGRLRAAVEAKADWLKEGEVLGVHIEGEACRQIMPDEPKGTIFGDSISSSNLQEFFSNLMCAGNESILTPVPLKDVWMDTGSHNSLSCLSCNMLLNEEDPVICIKDHLYHKTCFSCYKCCKPIAQGDTFFVRRDGKVLCVQDLQDVMMNDIQQLKIFPKSASTSALLDETDNGASRQPATIEQGCQTELPLMDQIDALITTAAESLRPAEWVKICDCLGLTVPRNDSRELKKAILEELGQWKGSVVEEGVGLELIHYRLQSAMDFAERPDLTGRFLSESYLDLEQLQRVLRQYYLQQMCRIPLQYVNHTTTYVDNIEDFYVDLSLYDFDQIPSQIRKVPLESHHEIFSKIGTNSSPNRLVLSGLTGSGKTTLISKLAYEWATGSEESPLNEISLLFVLDMDRVDSSTSIEDAILTQLLSEDTDIGAKHLKDYLSKNSSQVMVILDGCVKSYSPEFGCLNREGSIMKATSSKLLQECHVVITTKSLFTKFDQSFRYVEVHGFSSENVKKYVQKFFAHQDRELGERLLSYISNSSLIHSITAIPLVLVELCLMWRESKDATGIRTTQLFKSILNRITSQSRSNRNGKPNMEGLVKQVGKIALESLPTIPSKVEDDRLSPVALRDDTTLSSVLKVACQTGIMVCTEPFDRNGRDQMLVSAEYQMVEQIDLGVIPSEKSTTYVSQVSFLHKTFQEYCAAVYLVSLYEDDSTQFWCYLATNLDVNKAIGIRSVLMFACGLSQSVADIILPGLLEIFTSQLEHSIKEYYKGELPLEESSTMQEFILLCLVCNYESDAADKFSTLLKKLVPVGQMKFVGITDTDAVAIAYFLQSGPHNVHSIMLKAIPRPCEKLEPDDLWKTRPNPVWKTPMSKESLVLEASTHLDSFGCKNSEQLQVVASKTPMTLLAHIQMYPTVTFLPPATPYTLDPILIAIGTIKLEILDVRGFKVEKTEELLKSIEGGLLPNLSTLKLDHTGLKGHQIEKLAILLGYVPNLKELDLSNNKAGRCLSFLGASLSRCPFLQVLSIRHMQAPAGDMVTFLEMFSQFGSEVLKFHISGNEMNEDVAHAFLDNVPKSCVLNDLGISVGDISREVHRKLIRGIQGCQSLQKLSLSQSSFPDDLLIGTGEMLMFAANITSLSVDVDLKVLPQIEHSTWVDFKSKLIQANHLKKLNLHNIALETGDFKELLQVGHQCNLEQLRYFTGCLPDGFIIAPDHEFLELM